MRALLPLGLACGLTACGPSQESGEFSFWQQKRTAPNAVQRVEVKTDGRVIDAADALSPAEEERIGSLARRIGRDSGRDVLVLTVPALGGQTLEQFGWAVNGQRKPDGTLLLMVRPDDRGVRVESGGSLSPEQAARVAGAMAPLLAQKRTAAAIEAGLSAVAQLGGAA